MMLPALEYLAPEHPLEFPAIPVEGRFYQVLTESLYASLLLTCTLQQYTRALYRPAPEPEAYLAAVLTGKTRKHLRRQREILAEAGSLEHATLAPGDPDFEHWLQDFLELEASGWKGRTGSALASDTARRRFFERVAGEGFRRGRFFLSAFRLDGA